MKKKEFRELKGKGEDELNLLVAKTRKELVKLGTDLAAGKLKNFQQIKVQKRTLARIKTLLREKAILGAVPAEAKKQK